MNRWRCVIGQVLWLVVLLVIVLLFGTVLD